jgi:Transglutaminase-like superfamily
MAPSTALGESLGQAETATISNDGEPRTQPPSPSPNVGLSMGPNMGLFSRAFLFLRVFAVAAAVPYLLRLKISRVASAIEPGTDPSPAPEERVHKITKYVETAIRLGSPLVRPGCLTRGVTRYYFLRRCGMDVALCFGMGRHERFNREFMGHCWLVKDGEPFLELEDPRPLYAEMYRISLANRRASAPAQTTKPRRVANS